MTAPDVGIDEEIAHYYFTQILSGMVWRLHRQNVLHSTKLVPPPGLYP